MANRHLARSVAMQSLFEWDFHGGRGDAKQILERNLKEFAPGLESDKFAAELVEGVLAHREKIDSIIEKAAPEWPLPQIASVDRNVLRLALFELLFGSRGEVPPKVAINEAIELAKTFGSDSSGKFINGVLGTVYREIGEPGKDETTKKKGEIDREKLPIEKLGGGAVYRREGGKIFFALVHDVFGYWTLSKGHLEEGESVEEGTLRKLKEELGIQELSLGEKLGENEYIASDPQRGHIRRQVTYFLAETKDAELNLGEHSGLDDAAWFDQKEIGKLKIYDDLRPLFKRAQDMLKKKK
ncbi:MAG: transcription antitermination factor NusB [Patescibacteria group bacterium]